MKPSHITTVLALSLLFVTTGCKRTTNSTDAKITEEIKAAAVTALDVQNAIEVRCKSGKKTVVEVTYPAKFKNDIDVHMNGTQLVARTREGSRIDNPGVVIRVTTPAITRVRVSTAAQVVIQDEMKVYPNDFTANAETAGVLLIDKKLNAKDLRLTAKTAGMLQLKNTIADDVRIEATEAGIVCVEGKCSSSSVRSTTGGDVRLPRLEGRGVSDTHDD